MKSDITICTGIKDRYGSLFLNVISSMNRMKNNGRVALSVFDCGSENIEEHKEQLITFFNGDHVFSMENAPFARAHAFNRAVKQAQTEKVFLCDADMILPVDFVMLFDVFVGPNQVWFPTCFSLYKDRPPELHPENGYWRYPGHGMVGVYKSVYEKLGGLDEERYKTYGKEDDNFFQRVVNAGHRVDHSACPGLFHVWHENPHGHH